MKLSMVILEHWIRHYQPVAIIHSTEPTIVGIRLFSYEKTPDADYLYVGRNRDFFENSQSDEVLLVHRKDVISLSTQELEDVFDTLMDAFVFYQNWEQNMLSAFQQENPEQVIIDACKDIFGPIFFANRSLQITAFSRQYPVGSVNRNWDDFWALGTLSVNSLAYMQQGQYLEKLSGKWDCELFYEEYAENYPYSMMISQENSNHKLTGQLTIISQTPFQEYQKHLAIFLKRALCLVANHEITDDRISVAQSLFQDFLQEKRTDAASFHNFYQMQGWKPEQFCMVILFKSSGGALATYAYHMKTLRKYFPNVLFCTGSSLSEQFEEEIICCVPLEKAKKGAEGNRFDVEMPEGLYQMAGRLDLQCYSSYPFPGVENLAGQYRQARTCFLRGKEQYYDCALEDLADIESNVRTRQLALHPALHRILLYDQEKQTAFYEMLEMYLRCERDRGLTAQKLFVHKNTLVYRLQKAEGLFGLKLDDPYEREYLLLSFRCVDIFLRGLRARRKEYFAEEPPCLS
ncbi:MAG: helix-turn-helix domain-containing protein [Eubacteriales bacterium]|nr:helix-turn-helix domain-containing protein [Eubacteriales bacterium]